MGVPSVWGVPPPSVRANHRRSLPSGNVDVPEKVASGRTAAMALDMGRHQPDHPPARHACLDQGCGGQGEHRDVHELVDRQASGGDRRCPRGVEHGAAARGRQPPHQHARTGRRTCPPRRLAGTGGEVGLASAVASVSNQANSASRSPTRWSASAGWRNGRCSLTT